MKLFWKRRRSLGDQGEQLAARALKKAGYRILDRNVQLGRNEVDIIAREGDTVAFVEVKTRRTEDDAHRVEDNITAAKRHKLSQAARWYLSQKTAITENYRFDVVTVVLPERGRPEIRIYRDAFRAK